MATARTRGSRRHALAVLLSSSLCVAAVTAVLLLCAASTASAASAAAAAAARGSASSHRLTYNASTDTVPPLALLLDQPFNVSVMTQSYGAFNATLHLRASHMFPERLHGELVPRGEARLTTRRGQRALPHFARVRELVDEALGDVVHTGHDAADNAASPSAAAADNVPRPTLLSIDIKLQHPNSPHGEAKVYYVPANVAALQRAREAMHDGTAQPVASTSFVLRQAHAEVSQSWLSDVAQLVRSTTATLHLRSPTTTSLSSAEHRDNDADDEEAATNEADMAAAAAAATTSESSGGSERRGSFALHFFSEHEFTLHVRLPHGDGKRVESVWVHAYAQPGAVYDRSARLTFMQRYGVMIIAFSGFVVQVAVGAYTGAQRNRSDTRTRTTARTTTTTSAAVQSSSSAAIADTRSTDGGNDGATEAAKKHA